MTSLLQISGIAITISIVALIIKKDAPQMAAAISVTAGIFILFSIIKSTEQIMAQLNNIIDIYGLNQASISALVKVLGISVVSHISSEMCRDMGEGALAAKIEIAGTVTAGITVLPILSQIMEVFNALI